MDDAARTARLRDLALDRIKQPEMFTKITRLAADTLHCPTAAISIFDQGRERLLGEVGLGLTSFGREPNLRRECLASGTALTINDTRSDPRCSACAVYAKTRETSSFAGVPLRIEDGTLVGTLWCASPEAGAFNDEHLALLTTLAQLAEQCLNAHAKTLDLARANASLTELNRLFEQAETAAQIGSWRVDLNTNELHWSDQVFAIHGIPAGTPIDVETAITYCEPEDRALVEETIEKVIETGEPFSFEATIKRPDGQLRRIRSMGERIDIDGVPESLAGVFIDCTEEHLQTIALQRAATRDPLTGLYNRSEFDRRLVEALADRKRKGPECPLTVMLIDLDGFKDVNDRLGHLIGDRLLVQLAQSLERTLKGRAFVARWGGDEFALLFPTGSSIREAQAHAEALISNLSKPVPLGQHMVQVSATCGMAEMRGEAAAEELIRRADLALYHGKSNGRGDVHRWSAEIEAVQTTRQAAITQLSEALDTGRAFAAYQPIVEVDSLKVIGLEALLRLRNADGKVVSAGEFFPALLDPLLARRVSRFMLDQVIREAPALLERFGPGTRIGINVSEADLSHGNFLAVMEDLVERSGLAPDNIVLEVTETMLLLDEGGQIRDRLNILDERGFTIALDDFGTGFSSLTHLRDFPIRKVKIDKDFIATMSHDHQSRLIVQAMVQMGQSLDIGMIAEGVETEEQHIFLRSIGCGLAQGYRFARPASLADLEAQNAPLDQNTDQTRNAA
ncbi:MAG: EAL domain-containing protein [Erythrobacter sp.]|nr:EAL domain-containing protein [Erythrobacter sp.]